MTHGDEPPVASNDTQAVDVIGSLPTPPSGPPNEGRSPTRKVVAYLLSSADGVVQDPGDWVYDSFDEEMNAHLRTIIDQQDAVLLGRVTYESWNKTWPGSTRQPFAKFINNTQKHVVSKTLKCTDWHHSSVMTNVAEGLTMLKAAPGGDIGVHGSIRLTRSLLHAGLIDELKIAMMPVLVGAGERLLSETCLPKKLVLVDTQRTRKGVLLITYRRGAANQEGQPRPAPAHQGPAK